MQLSAFVCSCFLTVCLVTTPNAQELPRLERWLARELPERYPGLRPALSSESLSEPERLQDAAHRIAREFESILQAFDSASGDPERMRGLVSTGLDSALAQSGFSLVYRDAHPSYSLERRFLLLEFASENSLSYRRVMGVISASEREGPPLGSTTEYLPPFNKGERVQSTRSLVPNSPLAVEKCEDHDHITVGGWTCVKTFYELASFAEYPLTEFLASIVMEIQARRPSVVLAPEGGTSVWAVKQAGRFVLAYKVSVRSVEGSSPTVDERLLGETLVQADHKRLVEKLSSALKPLKGKLR